MLRTTTYRRSDLGCGSFTILEFLTCKITKLERGCSCSQTHSTFTIFITCANSLLLLKLQNHVTTTDVRVKQQKIQLLPVAEVYPQTWLPVHNEDLHTLSSWLIPRMST